MPKNEIIVNCIGFDVDGCLLSSEAKTTMIEANKEMWPTLNRRRERAFAATFTLFFTSRQSQHVNEINRKNPDLDSLQDPTSCFVPLQRIAETLESTLCPVLLADHYAERPDGYSYTRALLKAHDHTAYHPGFVFDKHKTGLSYTQLHIAANNMRNCDFLSMKSRPDKIFQLPFKSNAAYIYVEEEKAILYVNKAQQEVRTLPIKNVDSLNRLRKLVGERIENEEHDFEALHEEKSVLRGITLSDDQITELFNITGYRHIKQDYLIIYDAFDDLQEIMEKIHDTYKINTALIPQNIIFRLNLYSVDKSATSRCYATIRGTGPIDLRPKETLVKMAQQILKKEKLSDEDFNDNDSCFAAFISDPYSAAFFETRSLSMPAVKHERSHEVYALVEDYRYALTPAQKKLIDDFIDEFYDSMMRPSFLSFLDSSPRYTKWPKLLTHLDALKKITEEEEMPNALALVVGDKHYSSIVLPDSKIDELIRVLDAKYNPKKISSLEEKGQDVSSSQGFSKTR